MGSGDTPHVRGEEIGDRFVDLDGLEIPSSVLESVPGAVARSEKILPVAIDGDTLTVAVSDPQAGRGLDRLRFALNRPVSIVMAAEDALVAAIERFYPRSAAGAEGSADEAAESEIDFVEVPAGEEAGPGRHALDPNSAPITDRVQRMFGEAFRIGASKVLIMPVKGRVKVAYRIHDAVCQSEDLPAGMLQPVLARLMTMANLHGVIKVFLGGKELKLRAAFKPTLDGLSALVEIPQDPSAIVAVKAQAARLGYRIVDLDEAKIPAGVLKMVPEAVARRYKTMPVAMDGDALVVALSDPEGPAILDNLRFVLNRPIAVVMAPEGAILAAIDRYYGQPDPETADLLLWELAQPLEGAPAARPPSADRIAQRIDTAPHCLAKPLLDHLRTVYRDSVLELFEGVRTSGRLCRQDPASRHLEVVFPQFHLMPIMSAEARQYLEDKIWVLREAILSRLENFLERDPVAQGIAMTYAQYLACCQLAEGRPGSINPATARDAWINFMYSFALRSFPAIESNGALLHLVSERLGDLSSKTAALLDDPSAVRDPQSARAWIARFAAQTVTDEAMDFDSSPVIHLVELLIAEAFHLRAFRILLLPRDDRVEVACRIQNAVYARDSLPLRLLYPVLARLTALAKPTGELSITRGRKKRAVRVALRPTEYGLAALLTIAPDVSAIKACMDRARKTGCEFVQLEKVEIPRPLLALVPKAIAWKKVALPLAVHGGVLTVVVSEPPGPRRMDELRLAFNSPISIVLAPEDAILAAIYRHYHPMASSAPSAAAVSMLKE